MRQYSLLHVLYLCLFHFSLWQPHLLTWLRSWAAGTEGYPSFPNLYPVLWVEEATSDASINNWALDIYFILFLFRY